MKKLIIGNFRTGSWFLHDSFIEKGFMPLGELGNNTLNDSKNKISKFNKRSKVVGILHPSQMQNSTTTCLRLCEIADEIIYLQRQNTFEQTVSYAVALKQTDRYDRSPWLRNRKIYKNTINDTDLKNAFLKLEENYEKIQKLYEKFPDRILTLEKDLTHKPYPNKYNYKGKWEPPYNFKMLGDD